jgi:TetR/AcrR family transcriptional repressor of lmrAB and yxaGH operons
MTSFSEAIRTAAAEVFDSWVDVLARALPADGREPAEASALARYVVAAMEGALILARAQRSTSPLSETAEPLAELVTSRR